MCAAGGSSGCLHVSLLRPAKAALPCGAAQGRLGNWRVSMCVTTGLLAVSVALFLAALCSARGAVSYREIAEVDGGQLADAEQEAGAGADAGAGAGSSFEGHGAAGSPSRAGLQQPLLDEQA